MHTLRIASLASPAMKQPAIVYSGAVDRKRNAYLCVHASLQRIADILALVLANWSCKNRTGRNSNTKGWVRCATPQLSHSNSLQLPWPRAFR